jgi:hypothetical protein
MVLEKLRARRGGRFGGRFAFGVRVGFQVEFLEPVGRIGGRPAAGRDAGRVCHGCFMDWNCDGKLSPLASALSRNPAPLR